MHWMWIMIITVAAGGGGALIWHLTRRRRSGDEWLERFDFDSVKSGHFMGVDPYAEGSETKRFLG